MVAKTAILFVDYNYNNISDNSSTTFNYYDYYRLTWTSVEAEIACRELGCAEGTVKSTVNTIDS